MSLHPAYQRYDITLQRTTPDEPFKVSSAPTAKLHVPRGAPADEVLRDLLRPLAALHAGHNPRVPLDITVRYPLTEQVITAAKAITVDDLTNGWHTTATRGARTVQVHTQPSTPAGPTEPAESSEALSASTSASVAASTHLVRLRQREDRSTVRIAVTATDLPSLLTGFVVAFTTAYPTYDLRPHIQLQPVDFTEAHDLLQWNLDVLADWNL